MKTIKYSFLISIFLIFFSSYFLYSQNTEEAVYKKVDSGKNERTILTLDFSKIQKPKSIEEFTRVFHFPPVRQDTTGTCWCFSATSFLESELFRLGKGEIKLSEIFTVYHEYIEKCRRFIQEKGNSLVSEGSEQNAVIKRIKKYGIVRESDYPGLIRGRSGHNHSDLVKEITTYLDYLKSNNIWDEEKSLSYIKSILNKYLGEPPRVIPIGDMAFSPKDYSEKILKLPLDDYVDFISTKSFPFYTKGEHKVPDNWWHCTKYHNIPLDEFYKAIKDAISNGFSVAIGGDVSEPGLNGDEDVAIIPSFDCPTGYINQDTREYRFYNQSSTDDHAIHLVGYEKLGKNYWFLIKDSGGAGWKGNFKGYIFYREDYIKMKMLSFMVHKDAVKELLRKFN